MKKPSGARKTKNTPQVDPLLEGMMAKLLDRLSALERKMDAVAAAVSAVSGRSGGSDSRAHQEQNLQARERVARRERVMFEAICADCNSPCEVPFRPSEGRAIYCQECWAKRRSSGGPGRPQPPSVSHVPVPPPAKKAPAKAPAKKSKKK